MGSDIANLSTKLRILGITATVLGVAVYSFDKVWKGSVVRERGWRFILDDGRSGRFDRITRKIRWNAF